MQQRHVLGDGTLIVLADLGQYTSFIHQDWDEDFRLQKHLLTESDQKHIALWGTGFDCDWIVEFREGISDLPGHRSMEQFIQNTTGTLHLINFDSLTMAAQFAHNTLPDEETAACAIDLPQGLLRLRIVQLIDLAVDDPGIDRDTQPGFVVEYALCETGDNQLPRVPWAAL